MPHVTYSLWIHGLGSDRICSRVPTTPNAGLFSESTFETVPGLASLEKLSVPLQARRCVPVLIERASEKSLPSTYGNLIKILTQSTTYRELGHTFNEVTGLAFELAQVDSIGPPHNSQSSVDDFCSLVAANCSRCAACLDLQAKLVHNPMVSPKTLVCRYGCREIAVPVQLGARTLGFLLTSPVLARPATEARFKQIVRWLKCLGMDINREKLREAYFQIPVVRPKKMAAFVRLLLIFAEHLSIKSNQIALQLNLAESPVIARAREFIQQHYQSRLSLQLVAQAVHVDRFHLCRLFKNFTGVSFTAYVSRLRVETAKNLLLNPNLTVSEIAFEVGFQSISHFNLVFKRIVGESAGAYRRRISIPNPVGSFPTRPGANHRLNHYAGVQTN